MRTSRHGEESDGGDDAGVGKGRGGGYNGVSNIVVDCL